MRGAFRTIFLEAGGSLDDRARAAKDKWPGVVQVAEIADFILADHKQPHLPRPQTRRGGGRRLMRRAPFHLPLVGGRAAKRVGCGADYPGEFSRTRRARFAGRRLPFGD